MVRLLLKISSSDSLDPLRNESILALAISVVSFNFFSRIDPVDDMEDVSLQSPLNNPLPLLSLATPGITFPDAAICDRASRIAFAVFSTICKSSIG